MAKGVTAGTVDGAPDPAGACNPGTAPIFMSFNRNKRFGETT
jgi:hypothetical protein